MALDVRNQARLRRLAPLAAFLSTCGLAGSLAGCKIEPKTPKLRYKLSSADGGAAAADEDGRARVPGKIQAHIQGALEMEFGTPSDPQFTVLEEWYERGFNPNYPQYPEGDQGSGELSEEEVERIRSENASLFRRQLELAQRGEFEKVTFKSHMLDLAQYYADLNTDWRAGIAAAGDGAEQSEDQQFLEAELKGESMLAWYPTLRESSELYRQQCLHCHGIEGGGDGPTAAFLNPRPRDYRQGIFKFTPMNDKARPRRADLYRILEQGVTGTAMPSFKRFSPAELWGLVDYVRLLAMRGEVERKLALSYESDYEDDGVLPLDEVERAYTEVWEKWGEAKEHVLAFDGDVPPPSEELLARGRELYMDAATGNCQSCHGTKGLGDGASAFELEEDGSFRLDADGQRISAYKDDWGHTIVPRNLTQGLYRGGGRPIDIYRRIYAGINGTPMPGIGESTRPDGTPLLPSDDLWALVHYVRSLGKEAHARRPHPGEPEHAEHH